MTSSLFQLGPVLALSGALFVVACGSSSEAGASSPTAPAGSVPAANGPMVTLTVNVDGTGIVRSEPAGIECPGTCTADFATGTLVKLVSAPAEGWQLKEWSGACTGAGACEIALGTGTSVGGKLAQIDPRWNPAVGVQDCADAWGNAGDKLSSCDKVKDHYVVVNKTQRNIAFCENGALSKNWRIGLGFSPIGDKWKQGDGRTPEGVLYVAELLPNSDYHRAYLLSYPRIVDAARGYSEGLISKEEQTQIIDAQKNCTVPSQSTGLGGALEIHGEGSSKDWTAGCVAMENGDIDQIWGVMDVGDTIVVLP